MFGKFPRLKFPHLDDSLVLDDKKVKELDSAILVARVVKIDYLRKIAREKGVTAPTLIELKSENGGLFKEKKEKSNGGCWGYAYKKAVALPPPLKTPGAIISLSPETAYLCCGIYSNKDSDTCGWVKGDPVEREYDEIGPLSGSAGTRFYCRICGKMIGEKQTKVS